MKISIVLPARNEEGLIEKSLEDIYKYLRKKEYIFEILVVINGSIDSTEDIVKKLSRNIPQIILLKSKPGYGFALRKGLRKAKGDYTAVYNVDFYDFRLIDLVAEDMNGSDIVIGSKLAPGSKDNRPLPRKFVSILFNYYLKLFYGFRGTDTHGIKLIRKEVLNSVLPLCKTSSGIFDTEFVLRAQRKGFKITDMPVKVKEKRPSRFVGRLRQTPRDIYSLYKSFR